jgi:hypothetical protein
MGCLGVHFAFDETTIHKIKALPSEEARLEYLQEELEEDWFEKHPEWIAQTDKAWDAIHRSLTDGELGWENGEYPLNHVVLGGELLYTGDDYIMSLKTPNHVSDIAAALKGITENGFRESYFRLDPDSYGFPLTEEDYGYTWSWFEELREFYFRAATGTRYVLFTADQ